MKLNYECMYYMLEDIALLPVNTAKYYDGETFDAFDHNQVIASGIALLEDGFIKGQQIYTTTGTKSIYSFGLTTKGREFFNEIELNNSIPSKKAKFKTFIKSSSTIAKDIAIGLFIEYYGSKF